MGAVATTARRHRLGFVLRVVGLVAAALAVYLIVTAVQVWLTSRRYQPRHAGAIVVMGAAQYDGVPSPDLRSRLDEASLLWHQGYATTVMVTGWKEPGDQLHRSGGVRSLPDGRRGPGSRHPRGRRQ